MNYKNLINISSLILLTFSLIGCAVRQGFIERKNGAYDLSIKKSSKKHAPIISGIVYEYGTKIPLPGAMIFTNNTKFPVDKKDRIETGESGKYVMSAKSGNRYIISRYIGFKEMKTLILRLAKGDTVRLDLYMKPDDRPLY
ncbi:hypothetical protein TH53_00280 [Pedobacter lusitanus]|uniref:Carboxypeptidase regulatory-like domain-containing protein n=1 Tax=Pedobacter lusitanus TaxID=1503925 RepID=A0A0D0GX03_9SPHI|nr:hypothetical protein [Pedobacter lusitanus]KIO78966.1 hypothetical protein TH53_00280 [Pedobacter lusitanus]